MERIKVNMNVMSSDEILEQMYQEYLACPRAIKYLANLGLNDKQIRNNIAKIYDFVNDLKYCAKCPGVEKCQKENPLFCTKITYKNGYVDREIAPCKMFLKQVVFENQFIIRDFDDEWLDKKVSDLDKNDGRTKIMGKYTKFVGDRINEWLFISGIQNSGRSFTAAVLANDIARKNLGPIIFANCSKRVNELVEYYFKDKERFKKEIERYSTVPVLVLDDFGNEVKSDIIRDAIIFPIISNRASKKLFTIITSDFSIEDIVTMYSTNKAGEIRAKQIGKILKVASGKEINLGELSIY